MTIDERLEKLAERYEAIAQTVELPSHEVASLSHEVATVSRDVATIGRGFKQLESFVTGIAESSARLLHIAEIHERRITRLEGATS